MKSIPFSISWRLIVMPCADGPTNMAIDEALLTSFDHVVSQPVLRIYGWNPPALSVGRFQDVTVTVDDKACRRNGVPVVRRVTGGGAIFHADELTYSIVCTPDQIPPAASVKDSFRVLTGFLIEFYRALGLNARYAADVCDPDVTLGVRTPFCFAGRESFDIMIAERKIGGNAQRRYRNIIFQHGSIPIVNRSRDGLQYMHDRSECQADKTTSLVELGVVMDRSDLIERLSRAFQLQMGVALQSSALTCVEEETMRVLLEKRYTCDQWNLKGERA